MNAFDLAISLDNTPGAFAAAAEALSAASVNIEGVAAWGEGNEGVAHFLVTDVEAAEKALGDAGFQISQRREALFTSVQPNQPGVAQTMARRLADAGVNVETVYLAAGTRMVVVVDNIAKARLVWDGLPDATG